MMHSTGRTLRVCLKLMSPLIRMRTAATTLKIDKSGLMQFNETWPSKEEMEEVAKYKEPLSPLGKILRDTIKMRGPLTVHDYMSQALHHEEYGYYQQAKEKIGSSGDFVTSPELSQHFGEMIALWCLSTWENMEQPDCINLVELGPGNGTLMVDMLNIVSNFPKFQSALRIRLVEISPPMREMQYQALKCTAAEADSITLEGGESGCMQGVTQENVPITWYNYLRDVPPGPSLYIGHEILDVFPVHQFTKTSEGGRWRETLVDVDFSKESPYHFRFVKTPTISPALRVFFNKTYTATSGGPLSNIDENDKDNLTAATGDDNALSTSSLDGLEISPLAFSTVEEISKRVVQHQGAALLIDYGEAYPQADTIRGFKKHKCTHVLSEPGKVDITADVNFAACSQIAREQGASVQGPLTQGQFLFNMGLVTRVEQVIDAESTTDEEAQNLVEVTQRLLCGDMGIKFKAIAISHKGLTTSGF